MFRAFLQHEPIFMLFVMAAAWTISLYGILEGDWILFGKAEAAYSRCEYESAAMLYGYIRHRGFDHPHLPFHLGRCYEETGRVAEALPLYETAIGRAPSDAWAAMSLAGAYAQTSRFDRAVELYRRALALRPDDRPSRLHLARCLVALGSLEEAVKEYRKLLGEEAP